LTRTSDKYVHGTLAEKIEYDVYEENKVLKAKKIHKQNRKIKFRMILNTAFIFSLCFIIIYRYALVTELNYEIDKLGRQYEELLEEKTTLEFELEKGMNLAKIEEIARNKLGMVRPDKNQIVNVSVPKDDYTVAAAEEKTKSEAQGLFDALVYKINSFASLLY